MVGPRSNGGRRRLARGAVRRVVSPLVVAAAVASGCAAPGRLSWPESAGAPQEPRPAADVARVRAGPAGR